MTAISGWSPADRPGAIAISEAGAWRRALDLCATRIRTGDPLDQQTDARLFLLASARSGAAPS